MSRPMRLAGQSSTKPSQLQFPKTATSRNVAVFWSAEFALPREIPNRGLDAGKGLAATVKVAFVPQETHTGSKAAPPAPSDSVSD